MRSAPAIGAVTVAAAATACSGTAAAASDVPAPSSPSLTPFLTDSEADVSKLQVCLLLDVSAAQGVVGAAMRRPWVLRRA